MKENTVKLDDFVKIFLMIGKWGGQRIVIPELLGISESALPKDLAKLQVRLVGSSLYRNFNTIYQRSRTTLHKWGFTLPYEDGIYVPKMALQNLEANLRNLQQEYMESVKELRNILPKEKENVQKQFPEMWERIKPLYPSEDNILSRFRYDWRVRGAIVAAPEGIADANIKFNDMKQDIEVFLSDLGMAIRGEVQTIFGNLLTKLENKENFNQTTLDSLIKMCDKLSLIDVLNQKDLQAQAKKVRDLLKNVDSYDLKENSNLFDKQLKDLAVRELKNMNKIIENKVSLKEAIFAYKRKINLA